MCLWLSFSYGSVKYPLPSLEGGVQMIKIPTVFVLGAGASKPYGYPTGIELRNKIIHRFHERLNNFSFSGKELSEANRRNLIHKSQDLTVRFERSGIYSIDKFLSLNTNLSNIGRMAIAHHIIQAEISSQQQE